MKSIPKFEKQEQYSPRNQKEENLARAFATLKNIDEASALLRDLLTPAEIGEFANRFEIARLLLQ